MSTYNRNGYKKDNSFVIEFELNKESLECDSDSDSEPREGMECPEMVMDLSDLSDHMRKVIKKKMKNANNLWSPA